jgi:hypothetical protein
MAVISGVALADMFSRLSSAALTRCNLPRGGRRDEKVFPTCHPGQRDEGAMSPVGGSAVETKGSISLAEAGRQVRIEGWRPALPGILTAGGLLALLVSAALALLTSLPSKPVGFAAVGVAVYIAATELRSLWKALRD